MTRIPERMGTSGTLGARVLGDTAQLLWGCLRWPILAVLIVLEPFVRIGLTVIAVLGFFFSFFFRFIARAPHFPFWGMLAMSSGFALALLAYYALMRFFSSSLPRRNP